MNSMEKLIYEHMPIKIYSLDEDSLVYKELSVYAAQLQKLEDKMELMIKEMFINTAEGEGVKRYKEIFGLEEYSDSQAKEIIGLVCSNPFGYWNKALFLKRAEAIEGGVRITSAFDDQRVTLRNFKDLSFDNKVKAIEIFRDLMPCYLGFRFLPKAYTWNELEAFGYDFTAFDYLALSFNELDYD